jgi:streptogramin lyase
MPNKITRLFAAAMFCLMCVLGQTTRAEDIIFEPAGEFLKLPAGYSLGRCSAVATNSKGEIYLLHRGQHPLLCVDTNGNLLRSWGDDLIGTAHGLRVDRHDNVWVTDIGRHRVLKFDTTGKLLFALGTGKAGTGDDEFDRPTDIAFGPKDEVFVTDGYGNTRVLKFTAEGRLLHSWGRPGAKHGEFNIPHSIVIDAQGRLLVGDRENDRIQIFDNEGHWFAEWKGFAPYGLAINGDGQLFVADARAHQILRLDASGKIQQRWGKQGKAPGEFGLPHMLGFDAKGNLIVAEVEGMRFQKLFRKN